MAHEDQGDDYDYLSDGIRIFHDVPEGLVYSMRHSRCCVAVPHTVFYIRCEEI